MSVNSVALDAIPLPLARFDQTGRLLAVNRAFIDQFGVNEADISRTGLGRIFVDKAPVFTEATEHVSQVSCKLHSGVINTFKLQQTWHDDQCLWTFTPERDDSVNAADTSLKTILDIVNEAYLQWDIPSEQVFYSAKLMAYLGFAPAVHEDDGELIRQHVNAKGLKVAGQQIQQHLQGETEGVSFSSRIKTRHGQDKWFEFNAKIIAYQQGKARRVFGLVRDVTESRQLLQSLKKQNDYLTMAEQVGSFGHWRYNLLTFSLFWSPGVYRIHGVRPDNFTPTLKKALDFHTQEDQQQIRTRLQRAMEDREGFSFKSTIILADGRHIILESVCEVEVDADGQVISIFGVSRDITKYEANLGKMKLLALVNNTINVPIFFIDERDHVVYQDLIPQQESQDSVLFNYVNFSITEYLDLKKQARNKGQVKQSSISFDNFISVFDISVTYERDEGIYIWIVENITDKFRKEQQQAVSNRLALLGNTFGNVSHDINNVLGVALGSIEMLELKVAKGEKNVDTYIDRVKNAIDKGKDVTERLLAFTRKPNVKVVRFDPIKELNDNRYLFEQLLLNTIGLTFDIDTIDCRIEFPKGEFINILLNLVLNAQDAIREKGLSGSIEVGVNLNAEQRLEIHVKDSGVGILPEQISRIFDPFYSSKSVNSGNGIGLANVYSTMYKHNGQVRVKGFCQLGGAHFTLVFNCEKNVSDTQHVKESAQLAITGKRVLILDDEVSIGEFVALYLDNSGAITTFVNNKVELEQALASSPAFDVFITDMIMPDLSGQQAVEMVLKVLPDIKVYSMSGYVSVEEHTWPYPVLRKPFNSRELARFLSTS